MYSTRGRNEYKILNLSFCGGHICAGFQICSFIVLKKKPLECSGGEKARAVFARGIIMKPQIILADEPTASLDMENRERIVTLLFKMNKEFNTTIITVTHDLEIANRHDRIIQLERSK